MNSQDSSRTHTTTSEFTTHAEVLLKQYYRDSWFGHNDDSTNPQSELCEQLNTKNYEHLKWKIWTTFPQGMGNIFKIHRINAPQMYGMYLLHKAEMRLQDNGGNDIEEVLYHVTAESNAVESLIRGLDWRRKKRGKFGSGVSFGDDVDYCNLHANQSTNKEGTRVIIVSTVLMNDTYVVDEKRISKGSLIIPPGTADTTVSPNGHVFVKYNDFESYPLFFVYYLWSPRLQNESKFFGTNYKNLQKLQQQEELQTLCQQVVDIHIGAESISQQFRIRTSSKQRRKGQDPVTVKADLTAIAETAAAAKAEASVKVKAAAKAKSNAVAATKVAAATISEANAKAKAAAKAEAKAVAAAKVVAALKSYALAKKTAADTKNSHTAKAIVAAADKAKAKAVAAAKDVFAFRRSASAKETETNKKNSATAKAKVAAAAKAKAVTAAKVAAVAEAKAVAATKVAATAEAKAVAAAKVVAAVAFTSGNKTAAKAKAKVAAAAEAIADAEAKAVDAVKAVAAVASASAAKTAPKPKKLSQKKSAIKNRERRHRRAAAAEVDTTARSVIQPNDNNLLSVPMM